MSEHDFWVDYIGSNIADQYHELDSATYSADGSGTPDPEACGKIWPLLYDFADVYAASLAAESLIWETCIRFSQYSDLVKNDDRINGCNGRVIDLQYCLVLIYKEELLCRMGKLDRDKRTFASK